MHSIRLNKRFSGLGFEWLTFLCAGLIRFCLGGFWWGLMCLKEFFGPFAKLSWLGFDALQGCGG